MFSKLVTSVKTTKPIVGNLPTYVKSQLFLETLPFKIDQYLRFDKRAYHSSQAFTTWPTYVKSPLFFKQLPYTTNPYLRLDKRTNHSLDEETNTPNTPNTPNLYRIISSIGGMVFYDEAFRFTCEITKGEHENIPMLIALVCIFFGGLYCFLYGVWLIDFSIEKFLKDNLYNIFFIIGLVLWSLSIRRKI